MKMKKVGIWVDDGEWRRRKKREKAKEKRRAKTRRVIGERGEGYIRVRSTIIDIDTDLNASGHMEVLVYTTGTSMNIH